MTPGQLLRQFRESRGADALGRPVWSQERLGKLIGRSGQAMNRIENGRSDARLSPIDVCRIVKEMSLDAGDFEMLRSASIAEAGKREAWVTQLKFEGDVMRNKRCTCGAWEG